jgi:hypothetical protein
MSEPKEEGLTRAQVGERNDTQRWDRDALVDLIAAALKRAKVMRTEPQFFVADALIGMGLGVVDEYLDKIDGLQSDLDNAVETAIKRGAVEWGRLNYPNHPALKGEQDPSKAFENILNRLAHLERLVICQHCEGSGTRVHDKLGTVLCGYCDGTGNRIDNLENQL